MIATIDTANVRISKMMTLGSEVSFSIAVFDTSFVTVVSDELISSRLFIYEVVDVLLLYGSAKLYSQICYLKRPIKIRKMVPRGVPYFYRRLLRIDYKPSTRLRWLR